MEKIKSVLYLYDNNLIGRNEAYNILRDFCKRNNVKNYQLQKILVTRKARRSANA